MEPFKNRSGCVAYQPRHWHTVGAANALTRTRWLGFNLRTWVGLVTASSPARSRPRVIRLRRDLRGFPSARVLCASGRDSFFAFVVRRALAIGERLIQV